MSYNQNSGYGAAQIAKWPFTTGKDFIVVGSTYSGLANMQQLMTPDTEWVPRLYSSSTAVTDALAQCVAGRADIIRIHPSYSTVLSATELLNAETKWVTILPVAWQYLDGTLFTNKATATLPATTTGTLFTVTGRVNIVQIIGEVTTAIQAQACAAKLVAVPTVWSTVDLCATADLISAAVGTQLTITGTFANALVLTNGASVKQASGVLVKAGTIGLNTAATNTGSVKWKIIYTPVDPGAMII